MPSHFRLDDPMDTKFTNPAYTVDLTAKKEEPKVDTEEEAVPLSDLMETPTTDKASPKGEVVMDNASLKNAQAFDPTTLIPKKEKVDEGANEVYNALDLAVDRTKKEITEFHKNLEAEMYDQFIEKEQDAAIDGVPDSPKPETEEEDDDLIHESVSSEPEKVINIPESKEEPKEEETKRVSISKTVDSEIDYEESELDEDLKSMEETPESDEDEEKEANELIENLKTAVKEVMKPKKGIDLSKFSIGKQSVKASTIIVNADQSEADVADWILYDADRAIAVRGLSGAELIKLDPENSSRNRLNTMKDIYKIIYDHIVDDKKPDFMAWMKQTKFSDVDHIYFALYMATFHGSNFVSYQCPDCKKVFIKEIPFQDCIKYADDAVKEKVKEIQDKSTDNGIIPYQVDLVQASDKFVFGMKTPSIYNVVIETGSLPDNILRKYSDLIDTISYIDAVYTIDYTNMELIPVTIPGVKDDPVKSAAKRIKTLYDILKNLTSDEFFAIRGYIAKTEKEATNVSYKIPAAKCPDCNGEIEEVDASGNSLLFTRHHLGAFANM